VKTVIYQYGRKHKKEVVISAEDVAMTFALSEKKKKVLIAIAISGNLLFYLSSSLSLNYRAKIASVF